MMKKLVFKVTEQKITYDKEAYVVTDSWNYIMARFEFSEEWSGLSKTAIFKGTNGTYSVLLTDDACIVPHEVLVGGFSVSVYGSSGNMRITADSVYINAVKSGYEDNQTPPDPTPTVYEEILDKFSEIKQADCERAEQVKQNADGIDGIRADMADMNNTLNTKVDKVSGKGLSSNDYTDEEKVKLAGLENYTLPDDVVHDSGYVHTDNNYTDEEKEQLKNTPNDILTAVNGVHSTIQDELLGKVDKIDGKGLSENDYTNAEKEKLSGIEANANNYVLPSNVVHDASYVHTDNNYTTAEKNKLAELNNYDDTGIKADIAKKADKLKSIPHTSLSGNPITITDALADEQPIELRIHGCKNLIPYPYANTTKTVNGVTLTDNGDGSITANGTPTASISFYLGQVPITANTNYTLSGIDIGLNLAFVLIEFDKNGNKLRQMNSRYINYTSAINASYVKIYIDRINSNTEIQTTVVKPQFELGTTATEYEIRTGIGDLNNGKYEIPIKNSGKNIFDLATMKWKLANLGNTSYEFNNNTVTIKRTATDASSCAVYADISLPAGTYTVSVSNISISGTFADTSPWVYSPAFSSVYKNIGFKKTFTLDEDITTQIYLYNPAADKTAGSTVTFSVQIEMGSAVTDYEPYREQQTATAILDTPLTGSEYIDIVSKKRNGETDITVNGNIVLFDGINNITCQTATAPSKLEVSYYQDINKVLAELKNAILSQGGNV